MADNKFVKLNLKSANAVKDLDGNALVPADIIEQGWAKIQKNQTLFNNKYSSYVSIVGSNIKFLRTAYRAMKIYDDTTSMQNLKSFQYDTVLFNTAPNSCFYSYEYDPEGEWELSTWNNLFAMEENKINDLVELTKATDPLHTAIEYFYATGQIKVAPGICDPTSADRELKYNEMKGIAFLFKKMARQITSFSIGIDETKLKAILSPETMINAADAIRAINASDVAAQRVIDGNITRMFNVNYEEEAILGTFNPLIVSPWTGKNYDLIQDVCGLILPEGSIGSVMHELQRKNARAVPGSLFKECNGIRFKVSSIVEPGSENFGCLIVKEFPSKDNINAIRARLAKKQPNLPLPGGVATELTDEEYNKLRDASTDWFKPFEPANAPAIEDQTDSTITKSKKSK